MNNSVFSAADILLPKTGFEKWSVIACDQYTSEPEYWERVKKTVGDAPSTLRMILPEVYLSDDNTAAISAINRSMETALNGDVFNRFPDMMVYIERRQSDGKIRHGLLGKIDLTQYDYHKGTSAAVRATEETVLERIPPRVKIRENAPLELPHILLLADDPNGLLFAPLTAQSKDFETLYDFDLMENGGHLLGKRVPEDAQNAVIGAMDRLQSQGNGLLFCVGDGNHSLATAKACFEQNPTEQNRYALVEIVNIHDPALEFEPIYRVVFGADFDEICAEFRRYCEDGGEPAQSFTVLAGERTEVLRVPAKAKLAVGTLQPFLDGYLKSHPACKIDYIHGEESVKKLCRNKNAVGFLFDGMAKKDLFPAVYADGSLPRKTFSMGHADDKRFYLEARQIG